VRRDQSSHGCPLRAVVSISMSPELVGKRGARAGLAQVEERGVLPASGRIFGDTSDSEVAGRPISSHNPSTRP
jgi:hypothetical protein